MPLQSGNSSSHRFSFVAEASNFFIQFCRAVFQKEVANTGFIQIKLVDLRQTYHIIGVLYNPSAVAVLDRVAFERQQVPQRNDFSAGRTGRGGHGIRHELRKGSSPTSIKSSGRVSSVRRIELQERRAFAMKGIARAARQVRARAPDLPGG